MKIEITDIEIPDKYNKEITIEDIARKIKQMLCQSNISATITFSK